MRSERFLLVLKPYIGDAVMATPLLTALERQRAEIRILGGGPIPAVLDKPGRNFLPMENARRMSEVLRQVRYLRKEGYGIVVLVNRSFRSALVARLAGIPMRIGHASEGRASLLTHPVPYKEEDFEAKSYLDLALPLGVEWRDSRPSLTVTYEERDRGKELIQDATVGIQPGARFPEKQIPLKTMAAITRGLGEAGQRVALLGGPEEREAAKELMGLVEEPVVDLVGKTSIRESIGALANLKAMVGADTGLMHLAVGIGCPTATAFGPTNAVKWGHHYPPHRVVRCYKDEMRSVNAEEMVEAAIETLRSTSR